MENNIINLNKEQRETLEKFANTGVHSAKLIKRAKTILALDRSNKIEHLRIGRICEQIEISREALNVIRKDFLTSESVEMFLQRKKRETPPVPPKITGDVEARIIALACSEVPEGCAKWSLKLLSERSVELGIVKELSQRSVHRVLKKHSINLT
jgi:hypothetical protein